ncbi:MAG TPA: HAD family hydrolase [archaeon]|nr:HAD family hydrolase [archaeon]
MILIDMSGTIVDTDSIMPKVHQEVRFPLFRKAGFGGSCEQLMDVFREVNRELIQRVHFFEDYPKEVAKKLELKLPPGFAVEQSQAFRDFFVKEVRPVEGVREGLAELAKMDDLVLFTNSFDELVVPILERFELLNHFADLVCIGGTGLNKKHGHVFPELKARGAWAIVGDKPESDGLGEKHGIRFVDVRKGWPAVVKEIRALKRGGQV